MCIWGGKGEGVGGFEKIAFEEYGIMRYRNDQIRLDYEGQAPEVSQGPA